jgi:alpha-L-rhamnosidase
VNTTIFGAGRWGARWIWAEGRPTGRHSVALRRTLTLDEVPASVPARVCAVARYTLYVNGAEIARGPVRANPRRQPYDVVDLAPHLRAGENVVAAIAWHYGGPMAWWMPPPDSNDTRFGAFVLEAPAIGLATDDAWTGAVLEGWTATAGSGVIARGTEVIDLRSLPTDWTTIDPGWPTAAVRRAQTPGETHRPGPPTFPFGPFGERPIAFLDADLVEPDGDRVVVGTVVVDAEIPEGETLTIRAHEEVSSSDEGEHVTSVAFVGDGTRRVMESFDLYGGRRFTADGPVHSLRVRERVYPVERGAFFECSDDRLNAIYAVGRRSVTINSFDSYTDCPTREQRAWTGDSVVHQLVDLTTNVDWRLARWHPMLTASPRADGMLPMAVAGDIEWSDFTIIPDWALHWVHSVHNLYRYVGDREEIARLLPVVEGVLRWFEPFLDAHGCVEQVIGWLIIDWAAVHTEGVSGAMNGLWGRSLLEFAEMAEWLGDNGRADWATKRHAALRAGFERLWDAERGRYVDSFIAGEPRPMASQHTQAAAIVGGLAPYERYDRLVEVLTDEDALVFASFGIDEPALPNSELPLGGTLRNELSPPWWDVSRDVVRAQPFFRYVIHDALALVGRADLIPNQLLDWDRWAMKRCSTSWTETWHGGTVSHGWSSTPTRDLVQRVLGIEPAEPGFTVASIEPELGPLQWARGAAPTPFGLLSIDVRPDVVVVESPVPFDFAGARYDAGRQEIER